MKQTGIDSKTHDETTEELLQMLSEQAYTAKEVAEHLGLTGPGATNKLNRMVEKGLIVKKKVAGANHYYVEV